MKTWVGPVLLAVVLLFAGLATWRAAGRELRLADAERDLFSLQFERASTKLDEIARSSPLLQFLPGLGSGAASRLNIASLYWRAAYTDLTGNDNVSLLAANAAYRAVERDGGPWSAVVGRLDAVLKRYAEVLRSDPSDEDAAYNYELLVRLRASVVSAKRPLAATNAAAGGRTMHGDAGAPPEDSEMQQFRMIVPMQPNERREAEEAGRGAPRVRKG